MTFLVIIMGLLIGSFINVVIYRVPRNESIAFPASHCTVCNTPIKPYDNIPVISFLVLRGRCRSCNDRISIRYPLTELITGLVFGLAYLRTGFTIVLLPELVMITIMIAIIQIDIEHQIIPDRLNLVLAIACLSIALIQQDQPLIHAGIGFLVGGGTLFVIAIFGGIGGGDIKFMAAMGLALGLYKTIAAMMIGFLVGGVFSIFLLLLKLVDKKDFIPFGPFLVFGSALSYYYFVDLLRYYVQHVLG